MKLTIIASRKGIFSLKKYHNLAETLDKLGESRGLDIIVMNHPSTFFQDNRKISISGNTLTSGNFDPAEIYRVITSSGYRIKESVLEEGK